MLIVRRSRRAMLVIPKGDSCVSAPLRSAEQCETNGWATIQNQVCRRIGPDALRWKTSKQPRPSHPRRCNRFPPLLTPGRLLAQRLCKVALLTITRRAISGMFHIAQSDIYIPSAREEVCGARRQGARLSISPQRLQHLRPYRPKTQKIQGY